MVDASAIDGAHAAVGLAGAAGGGLGVLWLARVLFQRMITQYDKRHDEQAKRLDAVADRLGEALGELKTKVAVVEVLVNDARTVRTETQMALQSVHGQMATVRAELAASLETMGRQVGNLGDDVFVAHRRLELLAEGDNDIGKVTKQRRPKA